MDKYLLSVKKAFNVKGSNNNEQQLLGAKIVNKPFNITTRRLFIENPFYMMIFVCFKSWYLLAELSVLLLCM